ncbi:MAG: DUF4198 domain-containing protein [Nitrospirota bacterium]|nr:DUF4198 domain-containing protein [Nitrospirota bacterium]
MHTWITHCRLIAATLGLVLAASHADAHDVWITTVQDAATTFQAIVHHGHPGDRKTPDPDKLFEFDVFGGAQSQPSLLPGIARAVQQNIPVLITELRPVEGETSILLLAAQYDNGYWVKTTHGHRNTSMLQVSGATESLSSMKYAKAFLQVGPGTSELYRKIVGHRLEVVPLSNPFAVKPGEPLSVKVYFDSKPLSGVFVEMGDGVTPMEEKDIPRYKTDEQGIAIIPLGKAGPQLIVVDHFVPAAHPELSARDLHNATLSFLLPSPPSEVMK